MVISAIPCHLEGRALLVLLATSWLLHVLIHSHTPLVACPCFPLPPLACSSETAYLACRGEVTRKAVDAGITSRLRRIAQRSVAWYSHKWATANLSMSCDAGKGRCTGNALPHQAPFEITPRYLSDMRVPYNMRTLLPNVNRYGNWACQ